MESSGEEPLIHKFRLDVREEQLETLQECSCGIEIPDRGDPFPELGFTRSLNGFTGPLLESKYVETSDLHMLTIYIEIT